MTILSCDTCLSLLEPYADDELDITQIAPIERHLADCSPCRMQLERIREFRATVRRAPYHRAPDDLRRELLPTMFEQAPSAVATIPRSSGRRAGLWALAACLLLSVTLNAGLLLNRDDTSTQDELFNAHLRALMADRTTDVLSSDRHTVKPWFAGKLDFSPVVRDLSSSDFPLVGGRLDYIERRKVAVLVYRHHLHVIDVFVWPATFGHRFAPSKQDVEGYTLIHWRADGMDWWALSDLSENELDTFIQLMKQPPP